MPWIIDYSVVLEQMRQQRFKSLYYNSGAFGFPTEVQPQTIGWIGPDDSTIKPEALSLARKIPPPHEENLAKLLICAWQELLPGKIWIMPMSHWSYELDFGSREWMPALLESINLDPGQLLTRNNAAAIEFTPNETAPLEHFTAGLLQMLVASDFAITFPRRAALCTLHHHKQLWWQTTDSEIAEGLRNVS
jgi:hypothetical protein